jgi:hypothetical protein
MGRDIFIASDHKGWSLHLSKAGVQEEWIMLGSECAEISTAAARSSKQHTRFDPGIRQTYFRSVFGIGKPRTQKHTCRMAAHWMTDDSDATAVQAPTEKRNGRLDEIKLIEDALHVLNARPPEQRSPRSLSEA